MILSKTILILAIGCTINYASIAVPFKGGVTTSPESQSFVENKGQITDQNRGARPDIQFKAFAGSGLNIFIGANAVHYQFLVPSASARIKEPNKLAKSRKHDQSSPDDEESNVCNIYRMDVELVGANRNASFTSEHVRNYYEKYYTAGTGKNGAIAHTCNKIVYKNVYPDIDWVLYTKDNKLKYEFVVKRGGRISDIQLKYCGASALRIKVDGSLEAITPCGIITEDAPEIFQTDGKKIDGRFNLTNDVLSYKIEDYAGDLVIDPGIGWATYYGGSSEDYGTALKTDNAGMVYMGGYTMSTANIATSGAYQSTLAGDHDAYIVKFDSLGHRQWATYYGGSGDEYTWDLTIDKHDNIYIAGETSSPTGIATSGAFDAVFGYCSGGNCDGFLAKFNSAGSLLWGTYYGGSGGDIATSVATDTMENVFICGLTTSSSGIATSGAYQTSYGGAEDNAFLAKFDSTGIRHWGTYYYGAPLDWVHGLYVMTDDTGNVFMTGTAYSPGGGLATPGAYQTATGGGDDAFIVKFSNAGTRIWGTYYGGLDNDLGTSIVKDVLNNIYIAGYTASASGIAAPGSYQSVYGGGIYDGFLVKFDGTGARQWGTYYGGSGGEYIGCVRTDDSSNVYVSGNTSSSSNIASGGAYQYYFNGSADAFIAVFNSSGHRSWGSYYGGSGYDFGNQLAIDGTGNIYMAGSTTSTSSIATTGAFQTSFGGSYDGFLVKFKNCMLPVVDTITGPYISCLEIPASMTDSTSGGIWTATNLVGVVSSTGAVIGTTAGTDTIIYSVTNSCGIASVRHAITFVENAGAITGVDSVCTAATITLTDTIVGGHWNAVNGNATVSATGVVTGITAGADTIIYTIDESCKSIFPITVSSCNNYVYPINISLQQLRIYPNPTSGIYTIIFVSGADEEAKITVSNVLGRTLEVRSLKTNQKQELRIDQPPGIYFVMALCASETFCVKLVVQ